MASIEHMVSTGSTGGGQHSRIRRENSSNGDGVLSSKRGPRGLPHGLLEEADAGPNGRQKCFTTQRNGVLSMWFYLVNVTLVRDFCKKYT